MAVLEIWGQACPGLVTIFSCLLHVKARRPSVSGSTSGAKASQIPVSQTRKQEAASPFRLPCPYAPTFLLDSRYGTPDLRSGRQRVGHRSTRATHR